MSWLYRLSAFVYFLAMSFTLSISAEETMQCPEDQPCDNCLFNGWQLYVHYEPCYYTMRRCVKDWVPDKKRICSRATTKFRMRKYIDWVPEYTTALLLSEEPHKSCNYSLDTILAYPEEHVGVEPYEELDYFEVMDYKVQYRWVNEKHCKLVPQYYWKQVHINACASQQPNCISYQQPCCIPCYP